MQSQRLRLVSDHEMRLEQHEAERKDERRRFEDTIERLRQASQAASGHHPAAFQGTKARAGTSIDTYEYVAERLKQASQPLL